LAEVQKANGQRFTTVVVLVVGLFCTYDAIRALIVGVDTWWLWFMAAATQFAVVALRRATIVKPAAGEAMKMKTQPPSGPMFRCPGARVFIRRAARCRGGCAA